MARKKPEDAKPEAWMPFYIGAYLADTAHLTPDQHGGYLLLLLAMWKGGGYLPDDDEELQPITRLSDEAWARARGRLRRFFTPTDDGRLTQKRLLTEYLDAVQRYGKRIESSRAAVESKARKRAMEEPNDIPNGEPNGRPNGQHNDKDKDNASTKQKVTIARPVARFAEFWELYPVKKGRKAAEWKWKQRNLDAIADHIIDDVRRRMAKDRQWLDGYIPHGSTYVNGSGWEDMIDESPAKVVLAANGKPEIKCNTEGGSPKVKETAQTKLAGAVSYVNMQLDLGLMTQEQANAHLKPYREAAHAARANH